MVRLGSGRYAVPEHLVDEDVEIVAHEDLAVIRHGGAEIVRHVVVGPGEVAFGALANAARQPARGVRPRTAAEVAFIGLGPAAETFLRPAAPLARCGWSTSCGNSSSSMWSGAAWR